MHDKVERLRLLPPGLLGAWPGSHGAEVERPQLCKADLVTQMVYEFPELQIMGEKYARLSGESFEVARGIAEHYQPRFAGDSLPETVTGKVVGPPISWIPLWDTLGRSPQVPKILSCAGRPKGLCRFS